MNGPTQQLTASEFSAQLGGTEGFALSPLQGGMLYHWIAQPDRRLDIDQCVITFSEQVDLTRFREAWSHAASRHEALRTVFPADSPMQLVLPRENFAMEWEILTSGSAVEDGTFLENFLERDRVRGLQIDRSTWRVSLLGLHNGAQMAVWTFHHAILDGRSQRIVLEEVFSNYQEVAPQPAVAREFRAFIDWQARNRQLTAEESFWSGHLSDLPEKRLLPLEGLPGTTAKSSPAESEQFLDSDTTAAIVAFCRSQACGVDSFLQAVWSLTLQRYGLQEDVVFGAVRACRWATVEQADECVGLLMNTIPIRATAAEGTTFVSLLGQLRNDWRKLRRFEHSSLSEIQSWARCDAPLFDTLVVFEEFDLNEVLREAFPVIQSIRIIEDNGLLLTLTATLGERLRIRLQHNRMILPDWLVQEVLEEVVGVIREVVRTPESTVAEVLQRRVAVANRTLRPSSLAEPRFATIVEWFTETASTHPDRVALRHGDRALTYRELDESSTRFAQVLRQAGAEPGSSIGLLVSRSFEMITAVVGILKAGAAYVPIDDAYPAERIRFILEDSGAALVVVDDSTHAIAGDLSIPFIQVDQTLGADEFNGSLPAVQDARETAYIIYTSGSTGRPKGTLISHRNVVRLFTSSEQWFRFGSADVWTLFHSIAFDFSVWEIWGALLYGGSLVIVDKDVSRSPESFLNVVRSENVTVLNQTPSAFRSLMQTEEGSPSQKESGLRYVIFGGEALSPAHLQPWMARHGDRQPELINMYGITETTVHVTYRRITAADGRDSRSVIGRPLPDLAVQIVDSKLRPLPAGVPGEILVTGAGLADGYLNRPDLTAQRFTSITVDGEETRAYRSGDLGRRLPEQDIEYLGRIDQQVKIRGHRVELGEIECAARQLKGVNDAVAITHKFAEDDVRVILYVVRDRGVSDDAIRSHLRQVLPTYAVPGFIREISRIPVTNNGKLDRAALPLPQAEQTAAPLVPGSNSLEDLVAEIWKDVLKTPTVSIDTNFFDSGGHSLLLIQLHSRIQKLAKAPIRLAELFQYTTVRAQARRLEQETVHVASSAAATRAEQQRRGILGRREAATRRP